MTPFRITVATATGRVSYTALSSSSSQAVIDAIDRFGPCAVSAVRA